MRRHRGHLVLLIGALGALGCSSETGSANAQASSASGATSSSSGSGGAGGGGGASADGPTYVPVATAACPDMANLKAGTVTFAGQDATVWSGDPANGPGPLLLYYFATGSNANEPAATIRQAQIDVITAMGGAVVAQKKTTAQGKTTGNNVWYTGDEAIADEIVACAMEKQNVDPRRIHVAGYSAGAIQTTYMWFARSGYVASVLTYSGGDDTLNSPPLQDAAHPPAAVVTHGPQGVDTYGGVIDFFDASVAWEKQITAAGGFAIDCSDTGGHADYATRTKIAPQAVKFFLDHPYGVTPEPYTALPPDWPAYCAIQ